MKRMTIMKLGIALNQGIHVVHCLVLIDKNTGVPVFSSAYDEETFYFKQDQLNANLFKAHLSEVLAVRTLTFVNADGQKWNAYETYPTETGKGIDYKPIPNFDCTLFDTFCRHMPYLIGFSEAVHSYSILNEEMLIKGIKIR